MDNVLHNAEREQKPDVERHRQSDDFRICVEVLERIAFWPSATLANALAHLMRSSFDNTHSTQTYAHVFQPIA